MRIFSWDFETTVDDDTKRQTSTEVWSAAIAELYSDFVTVYNNIHDFIKFFHNLCEEKVIAYFHNVKFDGNFLLNTLMENGYKVFIHLLCIPKVETFIQSVSLHFGQAIKFPKKPCKKTEYFLLD